MDQADKWRRVDLTLAISAALIVAYGVLVLDWSVFVVVALFCVLKLVFDFASVSKASIGKGRSPLLSVPRLIISRENDAPRP